jgi:hypothetical protein
MTLMLFVYDTEVANPNTPEPVIMFVRVHTSVPFSNATTNFCTANNPQSIHKAIFISLIGTHGAPQLSTVTLPCCRVHVV